MRHMTYDSRSLPIAYCYHSEADKDETDPDDENNNKTDRVGVCRVEVNLVSAGLKVCGCWKTREQSER